MSQDYLFFDAEEFYLGSLSLEQVTVAIKGLKISTREVAKYVLATATTFSLMTTSLVGPITQVTSNFPWAVGPPKWEKSPKAFIEEARRNLVRSRKYLGLSQNELAETLGVSPSTIEKFEQGLNLNPSPEFLKKYTAVTEVCDVLKDEFKDRKFIVRSVLNSPLSALGDVSPLQFAKTNPEKGIFYVFGVLRRIYG